MRAKYPWSVHHAMGIECGCGEDFAMNESVDRAKQAATLIARCWRDGDKCADLPCAVRPRSLAEGYQVQAQLPAVMGDTVVGYKLAATAEAGQRHIGVDAPVIGQLLATRIADDGATLAMQGNRMLVAECEIVFKLAHDLPPRDTPYSRDEVMAAVASLHPALEIPDSRFEDFANAGAAQLAADNACTHWLVVGSATNAQWREADLAEHATSLHINGTVVSRGRGADVLGDPRTALTWLANQFAILGDGLRAGQMVTTGCTGQPTAIVSGDQIIADLGEFGRVSARI
ncbi:MAG: 2-keto-4-pentenoate hydratase [Gammaproteobacteria bacterium]|jgi:2-keto-4-pentenoate hydratase